MTPIEIMALIIIVISAVKIVVILVKPRAWMGVVNKVWASPGLMMVISLVLAAVSLYYLIDGGITIVQIFAVMLFMALLMAVGFSVYSKELFALGNKMLKDKNIIKRSWFYIIIWVILIVWAAKEILM